jgi:hypothetical protein
VRVVGNATQEQKMELEQQAKRRNSQTDQDQLIPEVPGTVPTFCPAPICGSVSDPVSLNPDPYILLNPDPDVLLNPDPDILLNQDPDPGILLNPDPGILLNPDSDILLNPDPDPVILLNTDPDPDLDVFNEIC